MSTNVRLLPLVAFAALCLVALKAAGLVVSGGYMLSGAAPASAQAEAEPGDKPAAADAPAQAAADAIARDGDGEAAPPGDAANGPDAADAADGAEETAGPRAGPDQSELDVLESLGRRRKALDQRAREIDLRENLLRAADAQVQKRIDELKQIEARIQSELKTQDDARKEQLDGLVRMYTDMKPSDAANILNRMDMDILTDLTTEMQPRNMSAILAAMDPAIARRLTQEIARRNAAPKKDEEPLLPKIEGQGPS